MEVLVAFSTSNKLYAKILRKLMDSHIHHTFLFVRFPSLGFMALEIDQYGIRFVPVHKTNGYAKHLEVFSCKYDLNIGLITMKDYIGRKYDWKGVISGAWRLFLRKYFKYETKNGVHSRNRMFCSEFVASILKESEVDGTSKWKPSEMSPKMLYDFVNNHKHFNRE